MNQTQEEFVPLWRGMELLNVKKSTFFYLVKRKNISVLEGQSVKDHRYSLPDLLRLKAERKDRKVKEPSFVLDWMYPRDLPAALELDYIVYDERIIASFDTYEAWLKKNPHHAMCAYAKNDRRTMLAYVGLMALPEQTILDVLTGKRDEMDITAEEILTYDQPGEYTLLANSAVTHPDRPDLLYQVLSAIMRHWIEQYPERRISRIYAQSASDKGNILIQKFYFAPLYVLNQAQAQVVTDAYVLDLTRPGASRVIKHYQEELRKKTTEQGLPTLEPSALPVIPIGTPEGLIAASAPIARPSTPQHAPAPRRATPAPVQAISGDMIPLRLFAPDHGIKERTASDHIRKGAKGEYLTATQRENAPPGQDKWFFNREQQRDAVLFWQRQGTPGFHLCDHCPHEIL